MANETELEMLVARVRELEQRERHQRRWTKAAFAAIAFGAMSVPVAVFGLDPVPNVFQSGDIVSAALFNENFTYLQNAITALESQVLPSMCASNQVARNERGVWVCSDDQTLTAGTNMVVGSGMVSLAPDISVNTVTAVALDVATGLTWNNSVSNGTTEMSVFTNASTCDATTRGRIRMIQQEDVGNSQDLADALCFCQRYLDRTPATPVETFRWVCLYPQSDGN